MGKLVLAQSANPCFLACSPEGPSTPFANPLFIALDVVRVLCVLIGLVVIVTTPRVLLIVGHWGQAMRFGALAGFSLVAVDSRIEHIGDWPSVRLLIDVLSTAAACAGIWSYFYREQHRDCTCRSSL